MDKRDLVELTIERLLANFEQSPESFELKDQGGFYGPPCVIWRPRIQKGNYDSLAVDDPNNSHCIMATYNSNLNELGCWIFLKAPAVMDGAKADHHMASRQCFMSLRSHYRKFKKLCNLIRARDLHKENMQYLSKLSSVFPDTLDKHIFKD